MDPGSRPPIHPSLSGVSAPAAPSLVELRQQLEAAALAYPELRQGLGAALADLRRALGEDVPTRDVRRRSGIR
jgi:hypothetical protein